MSIYQGAGRIAGRISGTKAYQSSRAAISNNKKMAKYVVGGLAGAGFYNSVKRRSGPPVDRMGRGRPTGPYMY